MLRQKIRQWLERFYAPAKLSQFDLQVMDAILSHCNNAYGVDIRDTLKTQTGRNCSFGSLYVALERLEKRGYIDSYLGEASPARGGRARRYYRVTSEGIMEANQC